MDKPDDGETSQGAAYDAMLSAGAWAGQLRDFLLQRSDARARRLFASLTQLTSFPAALAEIGNWLDWLVEWFRLPPAVTHLARYAKEITFAGAEAVLTGDGHTASNNARLLMETEFLLRDFTAEPNRIREWATLKPHDRGNRYSFGETRRRAEQRASTPHGFSLPARGEYQIHSVMAHPSPPGNDDGYPDLTTELFYELGDLLDHSHRVLKALLDLAGTLVDPDESREVPDPPDSKAIDHAFAEMRAFAEQNLPGFLRERGLTPMDWRAGLAAKMERWRAGATEHDADAQ